MQALDLTTEETWVVKTPLTSDAASLAPSINAEHSANVIACSNGGHPNLVPYKGPVFKRDSMGQLQPTGQLCFELQRAGDLAATLKCVLSPTPVLQAHLLRLPVRTGLATQFLCKPAPQS